MKPITTGDKLQAIRSNDGAIEKINTVLEYMGEIDGADWLIAQDTHYAPNEDKKENWFLESHKSFILELEQLLNFLELDNKRMSLEIIKEDGK